MSYRIGEDKLSEPIFPVLTLCKSVSLSKSKWQELMEGGGWTIKIWSTIRGSILNSSMIYALRKHIFSIFKGIYIHLNFL